MLLTSFLPGGGSFFWTIYNTGLTLAVKVSSDDVLESASPSSNPSKTGSVVTKSGMAVLIEHLGYQASLLTLD